ncbi:hypothetical protein [Photobacterium lutimaris]|uniref:hypothetical protein n=1 Tax=Photobacterium lutimaris TaxID=388278 RepID=UPI00105B6C51|nr:hypothetical protein [Photobacterium lutimaris]TDR77278.1 hypothetical protein DFP78_102295 [Photobacterium lutimaris]
MKAWHDHLLKSLAKNGISGQYWMRVSPLRPSINYKQMRLNTNTDQKFAVLATSFNAFTKQLQNLILQSKSLVRISEAIQQINDMYLQIASAAEEQSLVAEEINTNTLNIKELSVQVADAAVKADQALERNDHSKI